MDYNNELVIDMEDLIQYISKQLGVVYSIVNEVLDNELNFLEEKGIPSEERPEIKEHMTIFVDEHELILYINRNTGISQELVGRILLEEEVYLNKYDLIDYCE
ncbi:hypothetical protein [Priestia megaterium]|uniref:hypothetical protein n=1 Tax=Priestia megaterium TaxID=1404 RepID=UPI000BFA0DE9|nr:hypothetical protein [Priestia megaterium]PFQ80877.1 hypothetical protein COK11_19765 [Priestia megaterium]